MALFRLTLLTLLVRKAWVAALLAAVLVPLVMPQFAPTETQATLLQPARAQAAWTVAWFIALLWILPQAASFGDSNSRTGIGNYLRARGFRTSRQLFSIWAGLMVFLLPVVLCALGLCLVMAMPGDAREQGMWVATNLQFALLFLMVNGPLVLLAVALASRFGSMVGYALPLALGLYGLYGVTHLGEMIKMDANPVIEWIYAVSPQYYLADLTPRLIFKMGPLSGGEFGGFLSYFACVALMLAGAAMLLFRTEPLRS